MKNIFDKLHKYEAYVPVYLRLGLGSVFFVFGVDKFLQPEMWVGMIPQWLSSLLPASGINNVLGVIEVVIGIALIVGLQHQLAAIIAVLQLVPIIITMSLYGAYDTALRDAGLLAIALSLAVTPETILSIDAWREKKRLERVRP